MGLDWRPLNKPIPGKEKEFEELFLLLTGKKKPELTFWQKLTFNREKAIIDWQTSFFAISTTAYETLGAPQVGFDDKATEWAKTKYPNRKDENETFEEFMETMQGYYVVDLVPQTDGIPMYIALHDEAHVFRAKFLENCLDVIGEDMWDEAYNSHLVSDSIDFANRLIALADKYAAQHNCQHLKQVLEPPDDEDSPERISHILYSAGKWLLWWGERGHGFEADF